jgi:hypothetical protein
MKKLSLVLMILAVLVTPYAEAKTCSSNWCNFIDSNSGFENSTPGQYWNFDSGVTFPTETTCYLNNHVAQLDNTEAIWRFPFVDGTFSTFTLSFKAFLPGDNDNFYDELVVTVRNRDTNVSETTTLHGSSYNGSNCNYYSFNLNNNYSNANVLVTFQSGSLSTHTWQIDDVGLFGYL